MVQIILSSDEKGSYICYKATYEKGEGDIYGIHWSAAIFFRMVACVYHSLLKWILTFKKYLYTYKHLLVISFDLYKR